MKIEIRSNAEATIEGYVNAIARDSRILPSLHGKYVEQVTPKTFERALEKATDVELRFNHSKHLGSTKEGNLQLFEDNIGLYAKATITDPDVIVKARQNELRGWSFSFVKLVDKWEDAQNGLQRRFLEDIDLREVSILDKTPAYVGTSIEMRNVGGESDIIIEERAIEFEGEMLITDKTNYDNSIHAKTIEMLKLRHNK